MVELQDIFSQHGDAYLANHKLLPNQLKAMRSIRDCRTAALGAHIDECDECGYTQHLVQFLPQPPLPQVPDLDQGTLDCRQEG